MKWQTAMIIGAGGCLGAISRAYIGQVVSSKLPHSLPLGTLSVNLIGSLIMGILMALALHSTYLSSSWKSFLTTGFLGALTTYSTFAIESILLIEGGMYLWAWLNVVLNVIGTITMAGGGYFLVSFLMK
jgi:CrcB protein